MGDSRVVFMGFPLSYDFFLFGVFQAVEWPVVLSRCFFWWESFYLCEMVGILVLHGRLLAGENIEREIGVFHCRS